MVDAWSAYSGVALLADLSDPAFLPPTHTIASLTDVEGGEAYYKLTVPKGAESLRIQTAGGTGDADLYVRRGQPSVCRLIGSGSSWFWSCPHDFRSFNDGNAESVVIQNPQEGDYYVTVHGYEKYAGLTLTTAMQSPLTMLLSANTLAFAGLEGAAMTARSLTIAEAGGRAFTWTARTDSAATAAWLRLSAASGSNLSTLTVTPASAALAPGVYRGRITITASVPASGLESAPPVAGSPQEVAVTLTVGARPRLAASVQQLAFRGQPGTDPAAQTFTVSNAGGGALNWTAAVLPEPPAPWLLVNPSSGTGDGRVQVSVRSSSLSPGRYSGVIRVTATDALTALDIRVTLDQFVPVTVQSLRNAANPEMNWGISPGSRIILTGTDFHPACSLAEGAATPCPKALSAPPPTELSVTRVTFNGKPGQLWQVTPTQIDVAPPMTVTGPEASIVVYNGLSASAPFITAVVDQALGLFTAYSTSGGAGFVRHPSGSFVSRAEPLVANEIIEIVATGLGKVGEDRKSLIPVRVFLDGSEAEVVWAGLSEYEGGLYRVLTRVPEGLARRYPLVSVISDIAGSNTVSAGGPTIAEVLPRNVAAGVEVVVQLKGYNFAGSSAVRIGETVIPAAFEDGPVQTLTVTLPAALLTAGTLELVVVDRLALDEAPSNPATLTVRP
jgi:uncharacterized protein (TIGR03437 family)